ncbi:hypothetical protein Hanom_Chr06g00530201 [Helianthus anomalus]
MISRSSGGGLAFLLRDAGSTPTWCRVRHWWAVIGDPGKPGNFTAVPMGGWVTGFSPELVVDSGYSRSTPFVQWVPRKCSGLSLLAVQKTETE